MNSRPRVFVVHEPIDRNAGRTKNIQPAEKFGTLIHLVQAGPTPHNLMGVLPRMYDLLKDFTANDFILPIGHPILIGWACALASHQSGGFLSMLYWKQGEYTAVSADLRPINLGRFLVRT